MPPDSWNPGGDAMQPPRPQSTASGTGTQSTLSSPSVSHEDQLDRQMLRHLMSRYSPETLARLMQEENCSPNDAASVYTSSTYSSVKSDDAPSLFESSASSIRTLSDTSSARGSIISNVSAKTARFLSRKSTEEEGAPAVNKQRGTFSCGFCSEEGIQKTCTRKNDLKRHIEDFHNTNAQWHCRTRGCGKVFDWQTVYKTHLKNAHGGSRSTTVDDARVELCPQTVFACGFANCIQVFEASTDADGPAMFKEYVAHVVKHLDEGSNSGEWEYSTRIRNLMRQSGVLRAWMNSDWPEEERNKLTWSSQTSSVLRKRLETRHLGDLRMLIQYAIALGSNPEGVMDFHATFTTPVRNDCQMQIQGHGRIRINSQPAPPPIQHQQQQARQTPQQEQDPFSFKISRGSGHPPHLANYFANQRRLQTQYSVRPAVRAGRSARPPVHTIPGQDMSPSQQQQQHQQQQSFPPTSGPAPAPNMFDPNGYYQAPQQGQYMNMPSADGGIIADDLRSLRSMATTSSGHSNPSSADVDMADVMGDSSYLTQGGYNMGGQVKMEGDFEYMGNY